MSSRRACRLWLVGLVVTWGAGCAETPAAARVDPAKSSHQLVLGTGALCNTDKECGEGPWTGSCVLGTCFGLLTTETQAVRAAILSRIGRAPAPVQARVVERLLKALSHPMSSVTTRVGAVQGLGATLKRAGPCAEACEALVAASLEHDEPVAVSARLALSRRADSRVLAALNRDTREGTEHLRCSVARALRHFTTDPAGTTPNKGVIEALLPLLDDRAPTVRRAAAETLALWRVQAGVAAALDEAASRYPGDLRYIVARARLAAEERP